MEQTTQVTETQHLMDNEEPKWNESNPYYQALVVCSAISKSYYDYIHELYKQFEGKTEIANGGGRLESTNHP